MDDLLAALSGFDAEAPLASAPEPWDYLPMPRLRSGPPWADGAYFFFAPRSTG